MKTSTIAKGPSVLAAVCAFVIVIVFCGCPKQPAQPEASRHKTDSTAKPAAESRPEPALKPPPAAEVEQTLSEELVEMAEKPRDLGPPLVENPDKLVRLDPKQPVWIDAGGKQVVLLGEVCEAGYPLEFFASNATKAYESVVSVNVPPSIVHAGLLRIGAEPGHPARFQPRFAPPTGTEIAIEVRWKDRQGKVQSAPAQHWIRNIKTKKELDVNWVFAGSYFRKDEETGEEYYQANFGALVCVLNMPEAMLDLPMESFGAIEARMFEAFKEHLPPAGTPTTILLKPILAGKPPAEKPAKRAVPLVDEKLAEAERKALQAARAWLELIDREQYSRGWETAAERLNIIIARRDFIKSLNDARKPLGKVKSRQLLSKQYTRTIPDAPDGQYVVIKYTTSFEQQPAAVEMITLMLNGDNKWRVLGYHFK